VVGMSLGGLTTIRLAGAHPDLVGRAVVIDVTPSVMQRQVSMSSQQRGTTALPAGPASFDDFETMVARTAAAAPHRPAANIRRGVLHNSRQLPDGRWAWRYDRLGGPDGPAADFLPLWDDLAASRAPIGLVVGADSAFVGAEDRAEFQLRRPDAVIREIPGSGHSVQSDQPIHLAGFLREFLFA
jgi:esterase